MTRIALLALVALVASACAAIRPAPTGSAAPTLGLDAPLYFDGIGEPAHRGGQAVVTLHTLPATSCTAVFLWPGMPSGGQNLPAVTSGTDGVAIFRWTVAPATPPGSWRIDATCGGRTVSTHVPID